MSVSLLVHERVVWMYACLWTTGEEGIDKRQKECEEESYAGEMEWGGRTQNQGPREWLDKRRVHGSNQEPCQSNGEKEHEVYRP